MQIRVDTFKCTYAEARSEHWASSSMFFHLHLETVSSLTYLNRLVGQQAPGIHPPRPWITDFCYYTCLLYRWWRPKLRSLCLYPEHFPNWVTSPAPSPVNSFFLRDILKEQVSAYMNKFPQCRRHLCFCFFLTFWIWSQSLRCLPILKLWIHFCYLLNFLWCHFKILHPVVIYSEIKSGSKSFHPQGSPSLSKGWI